MHRICARRSCCYRGKERVGVQRAAAEIYGKRWELRWHFFNVASGDTVSAMMDLVEMIVVSPHCPKCLNGGTCVEAEIRHEQKDWQANFHQVGFY